MTEPRHTDDLAQRYIEASAQDTRRPPARVRDAARAHALDVIASRSVPAAANQQATHQPAANQSRWKISLLASVALAGITGLLVLQFDRGTAEEKELALGHSMSRSEAPAPASPAAPEKSATAVTAPAATPASPAESPPATPQTRPQPAQTKSVAKQSSEKAGPAETQANAAAKPPEPLQAPTPTPTPTPPQAMSAPALADASPPRATTPAAPAPPPPPSGFALPAPPAPALPQAARAPSRLAEAATADSSSASAGAVAPAPMAAAPNMRAAPAPATALGAARAKASQSQDLKQALIEAARMGNTAQLESLLQQGAALNAADETGRTALIWAVINNQTSTAQKLLALGANKAIKDGEGLNALQHARRLNLDRMAALLEAAP